MPAEFIHDLQQGSEDEVSVNQRQQLQRKTTESNNTATTTGAKLKRYIEINIDKLNKRYKGIPTKTDKIISRRLAQEA